MKPQKIPFKNKQNKTKQNKTNTSFEGVLLTLDFVLPHVKKPQKFLHPGDAWLTASDGETWR